MSKRTRHLKRASSLVVELGLAAVLLSGCNGNPGFLGGGSKDNLPAPVVEWPAEPEAAAAELQSVPSSGTRVGQYATGLQAQLANLQSEIAMQQADIQTLLSANAANVEIFYGTFAAVEARLHLGTLPNNPVLIEQWNEAQAALDQIAWNVRDLDLLIESLIGQANTINNVRREVQILGGDPEGNARDRDNLMRVESDATATLNLIDRLQQEALYAMGREASFVQVRRGELTTLQDAIRVGDLADTTIATAAVPSRTVKSPEPKLEASQPAPPAPDLAVEPAQERPQQESQQSAAPTAPAEPVEPPAKQQVAAVDMDAIKSLPLVIIRFDRPSVVYEGPLERAIRKTLAEDPKTQFNLVAVFPPREDEAALLQAESASWQYAESVFRSLTEIGVAPEQIEMRTQVKDAAKSNEVHIYVSPKTL